MKISILLPLHRYGSFDLIYNSFENQTFPKEEYEIIICDKLYNHRRGLVKEWANENKINVTHFEPKNKSQYHVHSSILNECLEKATGKYSIVIGDYTYLDSNFIDIHYQYNKAGYCLSAPQKIYGLPKLSTYLEHPISVFDEPFDPKIFKILPQFRLDNGLELDPKVQLPNGVIIDYRYWYNRNDSFPTQVAKDIGGWDESYNNRVGPSNKEFGLRIQYEGKQKIACDGRATIFRIMSYPIPPHTEFLAEEIDDSVNNERFKQLKEKYGVKE